jgi:hypothetical protein
VNIGQIADGINVASMGFSFAWMGKRECAGCSEGCRGSTGEEWRTVGASGIEGEMFDAALAMIDCDDSGTTLTLGMVKRDELLAAKVTEGHLRAFRA